jgi:ActR/RegA family two-component response regulator
MPDEAAKLLSGVSVLIVEDQYLIADEMSRAVKALGGAVVGPCPTVETAIARLESETVGFALLDLNLRGEQVLPVADELTRRGVPFAFATGYEDWVIPPQYRQRPRIQKPVSDVALRKAIGCALNPKP